MKITQAMVESVKMRLSAKAELEAKNNPEAPRPGDEALETAAKLHVVEEILSNKVQITDKVVADRMIELYGNCIRYCKLWKKWIVWNGQKWLIDETNAVYHYVWETVAWMYKESSYTCRSTFISDLKTLTKYESSSNIKSVIEAASWSGKISILPEVMDKDQWVFVCQNGSLDLRSGILNAQQPEKLITKASPVDFDKDSDCPVWKGFLHEIMNGEEELIQFLQKAAGYCLTGDTREQVVFILHGTGANGKSTFLNTIMAILGDYGTNTTAETFMQKKSDQNTNDIARLRGSRFVSAIETEQGKNLAEPLIKQLTGNDKITARFLYGEFFDYQPTFKVFMATNHKPVIKGNDNAIWRRIRLIPFKVTIPPEKQDQSLNDKLRAEYPGILKWMLEGCLKWQAEGLGYPASIFAATDEYRIEMDILSEFIRECCDMVPHSLIRARTLFKTYQKWCEEANEQARSERFLGLRLQEMGFDRLRKEDGRYWIGIKVKEDWQDAGISAKQK